MQSDGLASILRDPHSPLIRRILAGDTLRADLAKAKDADAECVAREVIVLGKGFLAGDPSRDEEDEVMAALERAYITLAPNDFHSYLVALEWRRYAKDRFYEPRMSILRAVVDVLTDMMVNDLYDIVMLSMPPRIGKSTLGLLFISWVAGRRPDSPILATGYAEKITKMFHDGLSEIYADPQYNYHEIFPQLQLVDTSAKDLTLDFRDDGRKVVRKYKSVTCRAIDGSLTGATEARQLLYADDLVRDIEEALSPIRLASLVDKLRTNLYSRKKEGCKELHIGTRWSIHDPLGWVESQHIDDPRCCVLRLPALDPVTDESNFVYDYGVGFSTAYYRSLRQQEDDVTWKCVYQQQPIEREGLLFPVEDLHLVTSLPDFTEHPPDEIFAFCDVAFGGDDFLSLPVAYQWGDEPPLIADWLFVRGDYKTTEPLVVGTLAQHGVQRAVFEANNGGDFYSRDISGLLDIPILITALRAPSNKSKEARIVQHSAAIRGFRFLDPSIASPMYRQALAQLTSYTMSGKNVHDDAPDSQAGLAAMLRMNLNAKVEIFDRRNI